MTTQFRKVGDRKVVDVIITNIVPILVSLLDLNLIPIYIYHLDIIISCCEKAKKTTRHVEKTSGCGWLIISRRVVTLILLFRGGGVRSNPIHFQAHGHRIFAGLALAKMGVHVF